MNFSDFGIKDESELEQDDFSLGRPTFGKDNQLTVIGWKGRVGRIKYYIVKCSICVKDSELFGDGVFRITKGQLKESSPCGCAKNTKWTEDQVKIRLKRKCKEKNYIFHGFVGNFLGQHTKICLSCEEDHYWESTSVNNFIKGKGCPVCYYNNKSKDTQIIDNIFSKGLFKADTVFTRLESRDNSGNKMFWKYECPVCSNDEYVKAGVCSGIFYANQRNLLAGKLSCRCTTSFRWTKEQYEYRIKKKMLESKTTDKFVGFVDGFKNAKSKFTRFCKTHGDYETTLHGYLSGNSQCPQCANRTQQEAYVNFIKDNVNLKALKFGIAKDSTHRLNEQNHRSKFIVQQYSVWTFPDVKSCKAAEKFIKQNLKCKVLTKEEMPDGYTETTSVENLKEIIKIYEDFGGVRKIIESENLLEDKSL